MSKKDKSNKSSYTLAAERPTLSSYSLAAIASFSIPLFGLFHEWCALAFSAIIAVWIIIFMNRTGTIVLYRNLTTLTFTILVFAYLISVFYATDRGMAIIGFLKFLPVLLFYIAATNAHGFRESFKKVFPFFTAGLTFLTALMMFVPSLRDVVAFEGRLHGFTQYPNTFAIILLAAQIMILDYDRIAIRIVIASILAGGILLTGSRAVIVLLVLSNIFLLIRAFKKHKKVMLITAAVAIVIVSGCVALGFAGVSPFDRLMRINFGESTLWFRVIYLVDAIPFSFKHPFGVGYLGYSFMQQSFQSAPYYVRFVHNDLMQIILDVGWIPAIFFIISAVRAVFSKNKSVTIRTAAAVILLHSLFDFDLQFISAFFILVACMYDDSGKIIKIKSRVLSSIGLGAVAALSVYFSIALSFAYFGNLDISLRMYPLNTECKLRIMREEKNADELEKYADSIIRQNDSISDVYASKAAAAFMKGEFSSFIVNMRKSLDRAPFDYSKHEQYCRLLIQGIEYYEKAGDHESVEVCINEISNTVARYKKTVSNINPLYKKTVITPVFFFPEDIESLVSSRKS